MTVQIRPDRDVNALNIKLKPGGVVRAVELTDTVNVDLDANGNLLGIEFINADELVPFLRDHADDAAIPPRVRALFRVTAA